MAEHTALDGTRLSELYRNFKVRVLICAVARQGETIIPSGDFTLRAGDKIYLIRRTPGTGEVLPASGRIPGPGLFGHDRGRQQNVLLSGI